MAKRSTTDYIVVHCSGTKPSMDVGAVEIDAWHRHRGWLGIGYNFVIKRDGTLETGRDIDAVGAHAAGFNDCSIGICLVGGVTEDDVTIAEDNFTGEQFDKLKELLNTLLAAFPNVEVVGHRDLPKVTKDCPSFNVKEWLENN